MQRPAILAGLGDGVADTGGQAADGDALAALQGEGRPATLKRHTVFLGVCGGESVIVQRKHKVEHGVGILGVQVAGDLLRDNQTSGGRQLFIDKGDRCGFTPGHNALCIAIDPCETPAAFGLLSKGVAHAGRQVCDGNAFAVLQGEGRLAIFKHNTVLFGIRGGDRGISQSEHKIEIGAAVVRLQCTGDLLGDDQCAGGVEAVSSLERKNAVEGAGVGPNSVQVGFVLCVGIPAGVCTVIVPAVNVIVAVRCTVQRPALAGIAKGDGGASYIKDVIAASDCMVVVQLYIV